jgi:hypothetical protein
VTRLQPHSEKWRIHSSHETGRNKPCPLSEWRFALSSSYRVLGVRAGPCSRKRNELIENYVARYKSKLDQHKPFDVARLLAFLETKLPDGRSWRKAESEGSPFASGLEVSCVEALRAAGLVTAASLKATLTSSKFRSAAKSFASLSGIGPAQVSHLAIVVLAVAVKNLNVVRLHFPEMMFDSAITTVVERRSSRRRA